MEYKIPLVVLEHIGLGEVCRGYNSSGDKDARGNGADFEILEDPLAVELYEEVGDVRLPSSRVVPIPVPRKEWGRVANQAI